MNLFKRIYKNLEFRKKVFHSTPYYIREKRKYGLQSSLQPYLHLHSWFTTSSGAKVHLGKDVIDEYILKDLFTDTVGRYFPDYLHLQKGDIVLDVGAHHGLYAMELIARFPGIKVLCIEPDPEGASIISKHIQKNNANASIIPFAIGAEEKTAFLADNNDGSWGKTVEESEMSNAVRVTVKTLETVVAKDDLKNIKLIKSNCEGGEFELIPQVIELSIKPDLIVLMIHPERGNSAQLVNLLIDYGYDAKQVLKSDKNPCWHFIKK